MSWFWTWASGMYSTYVNFVGEYLCHTNYYAKFCYNLFADKHSQKIALHQRMVDMAIRDYRALTMVKYSNSQDSPMAPCCGCQCPQASSCP